MRAGGWCEISARWTIRAYARHVVQRDIVALDEGREHLPASGPTIVAARHYHHLYDAALLLAAIERPTHFLVALDSVGSPAQKRLLETACRMACWPVLLRPVPLGRRAEGDGRSTRRRAAVPAPGTRGGRCPPSGRSATGDLPGGVPERRSAGAVSHPAETVCRGRNDGHPA